MNIIFDKYTSKKKKDILDYAKVLDSIITIENNGLWSNSRSFTTIAKRIVNYYVDNYYFHHNDNRDNPIEYFNDNINSILLSIIDYYKSINQSNLMVEKKNETLLLALLICSATYVDIAANVIDDEYILLKNRFKQLLKHLSKTKILKIYYNDRITISSLFDLVKKNMNLDKKFFETFKELSCKNEYQSINKEDPFYKVKFIYKVDGIENFGKDLVFKYRDLYVDKFIIICYELLLVTLLKQLIVGKKNIIYLVPITDNILAQERIIGLFDDELIKKYIALSVPLKNYEKTINQVNKYQEKGIKTIYCYDEDDITILNDKKNIEIICNHEFYIINKDNVNNITLYEKSLGQCVIDDVMLKEIN